MVNLRINWTSSSGAVRNRTYQVGVKGLFVYLVYHMWQTTRQTRLTHQIQTH